MIGNPGIIPDRGGDRGEIWKIRSGSFPNRIAGVLLYSF